MEKNSAGLLFSTLTSESINLTLSWIHIQHNSFSPSDNLVHKVDVYFCQGGERMGWPSFSPPLTSNFMFYAYSGQGNWRLAEFFPTPLTICTTLFPHVIILCIRLMFNLVGVGKEWAGPVFPHPLKSNGYMCIHDRVRLAEFWQTINHLHNSFPPPDNLLNKVDV